MYSYFSYMSIRIGRTPLVV